MSDSKMLTLKKKKVLLGRGIRRNTLQDQVRVNPAYSFLRTMHIYVHGTLPYTVIYLASLVILNC